MIPVKKVVRFIISFNLFCANTFAMSNYATGNTPVSLVFHPDGGYAYSVNSKSNDITEFRLNSTTGDLIKIGTIATGAEGTFGASFDPQGKYFLVTSSAENSIYEYSVDLSTGLLKQIGVINTGNTPIQAQFNIDGKYLYIVSLAENQVYQYSFDSKTGKITPLSPLKFRTHIAPTGIGLSNDGKYMYEISSANNDTTRYTMGMNGQLSEQETYKLKGVLPVYSNFDASGNISLCVNNNSNNMDVFIADNTTGKMMPLGTVKTGTNPNSLPVYDSTNKYVYVANDSSNDISAYKLNSNGTSVSSIIQPMGCVRSGGVGPDWLVASPSQEYLFVVNGKSNNITKYSIDKNGILK